MHPKPLESLERRTLLTVTLNNGLLSVVGTDDPDTILFNQIAAQIEVDLNGTVTPFDAALVDAIDVNALGGADTVTVNVNRPTTILGGAGNDTITGSDGGNDSVIGQQGADTFFGRGGDDTFVWNPGDGNDLIEGDDGNDTHIFNGSAADEIINVEPNAGRVRLTRNVGNIVMDIGTFENIVVNALGGNDTVSGATGLAGLTSLTFDGGAGDDILNGGNGADLLLGGPGNDTIDGNAGADTAHMGDGDDTFIWDPGDGSDFVEGEGGFDTLLFNGSAGNEIFDASANGDRLRFFRNVGNIVMDVGTTERLDLRAMDGDDQITINELAGTGVITVFVDGGAGVDTFAGSSLPETFIGGPGPDFAQMGAGDDTFIWNPGDGSDFIDGDAGFDTLLFNGSNANENFLASRGGNRLHFFRDVGSIVMDVGTTERLDLRAFGGNDSVVIEELGGTGVTSVVVDGGEGNDSFVGSSLRERFLGGAGDDTAHFGDGDFLDMGEGHDTLIFFGTSGRDNIHIDRKQRGGNQEVIFHGTVGNRSAIFNGGERIVVMTLGGNDKVKVHKRAQELWDVEVQ